jgi:hypothetical protein
MRFVHDWVEPDHGVEKPASGKPAVVFGEATATPKIDITALHTKIGELTLEDDFLEKALTKRDC